MSIYKLKPKFQSLLRPGVRALYRMGATANGVTITACVISVAIGLYLYLAPAPALAFILIPVWMLLRMALNAVDGMLAREFGQKSRLGAYLNELSDVISDAALYLPFATLSVFSGFWLGLVILLAALSEFAGVLASSVGASRRYEGPMGKSDRAFVFGALGLWVAFLPLPSWIAYVLPLVALMLVWTIINRVAGGLAEARQSATESTLHEQA